MCVRSFTQQRRAGEIKNKHMSSSTKLEYLKQRYALKKSSSADENEDKKESKKKKKKVKKLKREEGVKVYDEDELFGFATFDERGEEEEVEKKRTHQTAEDFERGENAPVIVTDANYVARSKREEDLEKNEKKNATGGWVTVVEGTNKEDEEEERPQKTSKAKKKKRRHDSDDSEGEDDKDDEEEMKKSDEEKKANKKKNKKRRQRHDSDSEGEEEKEGEKEGKRESVMTTSAKGDDVKIDEVVEYDSDGDVVVRKVTTKTTEMAARNEEPEQKVEYDSDGDIIVKPPPTTTNKATKNKTGLVSASEIVKEAELRRKEQEERINNMSAERSGKNAKTLIRDKTTGRLLTQEEIEERTKATQEPKKEREKPVWGAGLKQQQIEKEKEEELRKASEAPFARSEVDAAWNSEKMNEVRYGDPMAKKAYEKQQKELEKQQKNLNVMQGVDKKLAKKHGFKVPQEIPKHSWRNKAVTVDRNRYGIEPGRHWDGVDRGTGFEKKWLQKSELRKRIEIEKRGTRNLTDTVYDEDDFNEDLGT